MRIFTQILSRLGASSLALFPLLPSAPQEQAQPKTQVFALGMIHDGHRTSELWGLDQVRATLRAIDPEVVCAEIPPANWPSTLATWKARKVVEDSRVRVFPEYVDVLMPLTDELSFEVLPCAGWTPEMASTRRARIASFGTSEEDAPANAAYQADEEWTAQWLREHPAPGEADDPYYIHSPAYDLRTKVELGAYEHHLNEVIGWPGGWTYINHEHFALIREAIEAHAGKRIVITFGAGHKYWFLEQLRAMPNVELMDVRNYLPGAEEHALTQEQLAQEELLIGLDSLRAWCSDSRGTSEAAWKRMQGMLRFEGAVALLGQLKLARGSQRSEFASGPFLGKLELESKAGESWSFKLETRRLQAAPGDASWLWATLQRDATAPGGFAWTRLELPNWWLQLRAE